MMRPTLPILVGATLAMLAVSGCKKREEERPAENMVVEQPTPPVEAAQPTPVAPADLPKSEASVAKPKPAPEPSPEQQVLDDADATGMTARVSRGGDEDAPSGDGNSQH